MGIHHFEFDAIPRALLEHYLDLGNSVSSIEELIWLPGQSEQPSSMFLSQLRKLLPNDTSWGPVEEYESDSDWGSDLRIWHSEEPRLLSPVESITFRFAPVGDPVELLHKYVGLLAEETCVVFSREFGTWFEPTSEIVSKNLEKSRAFRFAQNPHSALDELAKNPVRSNKTT